MPVWAQIKQLTNFDIIFSTVLLDAFNAWVINSSTYAIHWLRMEAHVALPVIRADIMDSEVDIGYSLYLLYLLK